MKDIVEQIYEGKLDDATSAVKKKMSKKAREALLAQKKKLAAHMFAMTPKLHPHYKLEEDEEITDDVLDEAARIKIVRARIRGGKVQRRKKVSTVPGMTMRGGKLIRMSPAERRKRKMGARRAKLKTRSKRVQMLRKRKMSLMKRKRLGL